MAEKYYVTTPIYYPNDVPHVGHAYTTIAADVVARFQKLLGKEVFFLTGTDEHGKKIQETAEKAGKKPKEFVDALIPKFKDAWKKLNIEYDRFIRTTDKDHEKNVQEVLQKVYDNGDIYLGEYEGLYCTGCERYYTEKELEEGCCPIHKKPVELLKEKSYFFKLSKYKDFLLDLYEKNPDFVQPASKRNEVVSRVKEDLRDFSISRTSFDWGIPLPFDKEHVCYVWFDALLNYHSGVKGTKFYPADIHIMAKDILWFHAVYWPAMLKSAGIELPKKEFIHGYWTIKGDKISKSRGRLINVDELIEIAGVDSARYFLLRQTSFGDDGDFDERAVVDRHNNELLNKLGNLVSRTAGLIEKNGIKKCDNSLKIDVDKVKTLMENFEFDKALNEIFAYIDRCNEYVQNQKPWETKDKHVLYELADSIKKVTILLSPFMPKSCDKIAKQFDFKISLKELETPLKEKAKIKKGDYIFTRVEYKEQQKLNKEPEIKEIMEGVATIAFEDWSKVDLRVAEVKDVEDIEGADKLYKISLDIGEPRTVCAGLKKYYSKDELKGMKVIIIANLAPRKMKGIESKGMLLAAVNNDESKVVLIGPTKDIDNGSKVF